MKMRVRDVPVEVMRFAVEWDDLEDTRMTLFSGDFNVGHLSVQDVEVYRDADLGLIVELPDDACGEPIPVAVELAVKRRFMRLLQQLGYAP